MSKKSRFWEHFEKQHGKSDQTLFKSEQQHSYHIYRSLSTELSWKKSLLVKFKIFRPFVNKFTVGHKYSLLNRDKLTQPINMQLSQKQNSFSRYFSPYFSNVDEIFNILNKKMTLIADVISKLWNSKNIVR